MNIRVRCFLLALFVLSGMSSYSQLPLTEKMEWKPQGEAVMELYKSMRSFAKTDKAMRREMKAYINSNFEFVKKSVKGFVFRDKGKVMEWWKSFQPLISYAADPPELRVSNHRVLILRTLSGSGIPRWSFYVFRYDNERWELLTTSQVYMADIREELKIRVDDEQEKILFETPTAQIGELPFSMLAR